MKFMMLICAILLSFHLYADEARFIITDRDSQSYGIRAQYIKNNFKENEIHLRFDSLPELTKDFKPEFATGRDLNGDELIDTWFVIDPEKGFLSFEENCPDKICEDVIKNKVVKRIKRSQSFIAYAAYMSILKYLFISADEKLKGEKDFFKNWCDLEEFRIRFEKEMSQPKTSLHPNQVRESYELLVFGYQHQAEIFLKSQKEDVYKNIILDGVSWAAGAYVFKALSAGLVRATQGLSKIYQEKLGSKITLITKNNSALKITTNSVVRKWTIARFKQSLNGGLSYLKIRSKMMERLLPMKGRFLKPIKAGLSEWKYLLLNSGIQLSSETFAHYDDIKSNNHLNTVQNLINHPEVQQNVAYMASETFMMTAAVSSLKTVKARYAVCAAIALTNSAMINFLIRDEANPSRVAMDTAWEVLIGSTQVQIDMLALSYFEGLAKVNNNSKLKLLGYAVALSDQAFGYFAYSKASSYVDQKTLENKLAKQEQKHEDLVLVPMFASTSP